MASVKIIVKNLIPYEQLNGNDQDSFDIITGEHSFDVPVGEEGLGMALDQFHTSIPIQILEDFGIDAFFVPTGDNNECLESMVCPECGHHESFLISCRSLVKMYDHGSEESGADEYENDSGCRCPNCQHTGIVADFNHTDEDLPTNADRAELGAQLIELAEVSSEPGSIMVDLLTNLMHFCNKDGGCDFDTELNQAYCNFHDEVEEEVNRGGQS